MVIGRNSKQRSMHCVTLLGATLCEFRSTHQEIYVTAAPVPVVEHIAPALAASYGVPVATAFSAPAPVVEHISPDPTLCVAPAPVVEYISPDLAEYAVAEYITPAPMEFAEAALHEIDEEICSDDFEELSSVARGSRKRLWRRASGMAAHHLRVLQNLRGHGEGIRNVCVTRRVSTR